MVYAVFPDPRTLLVIQAAVIAAAAVPLYLVVFRETQSQFLSLAASGLYLANPALHGVIRFDFHTECFLPLFIFLIYFSYPRVTPALFYASVILLLSTIEYSAVIGLGIGVSFWVSRGRVNKRILFILLSSLSLLVVVALSTLGGVFRQWNWSPNWLTQQFVGSSSQPTNTQGLGFVNNPGVLLASIQYDLPLKILYLLLATAPLWSSIVRYRVRMIPAFPWIAIVIITSRFSYFVIDFQYSVFLIPFVYLAAIPFFKSLEGKRTRILSLILVALSITVFSSALSPIRPYSLWPSPNPLESTIVSISSSLPANATVLTESDIFPQLANHPYVTINYTAPEPPQYILVNFESSWYNWTNTGLGYPQSPREQVQRYLAQYSYVLTFQAAGLHLYELASPQQLYPTPVRSAD